MKIVFLLIFILNFVLAIERPRFEDFAVGYEKNKASMLNYEGMPAFALSENVLAVLKLPNAKLNRYVKYDPFLNLYLVRTDFSLIAPTMGDEEKLTRNDWVGIWDPNEPYIGHIRYLGQDIYERDQLDFNGKIGLLGTPCCEMMGIALNNNSFIGNRYLRHFMRYNDVYWGDIGVDFTVRENKIYVNNIRKNGQFLINDEIISVDGMPIRDIRKLNEKILFADRASTLYFGVLRDNMDLNISTEVFAKDLSRFKLEQNKPMPKITDFRTNVGLTLNSALVVTKVEPNSQASLAGFMVEDQILRLNNILVKDFKEFQDLLSSANELNILIERKSDRLPLYNFESSLWGNSSGDGKFQFFIRLIK